MSRFHRLRKATAADIPFILKLEANPENTYVHSYPKEQHIENLANEAAHYFIAEDKGSKPLGFAILFDDGPARVEWRRIIIDAPGQGVGRNFMKAVLQYFRDLGTGTVWLDVYDINARARHVYSSLGFKECGGKPLESNPDITLVVMELTLV